jgi:hypothetical protein
MGVTPTAEDRCTNLERRDTQNSSENNNLAKFIFQDWK